MYNLLFFFYFYPVSPSSSQRAPSSPPLVSLDSHNPHLSNTISSRSSTSNIINSASASSFHLFGFQLSSDPAFSFSVCIVPFRAQHHLPHPIVSRFTSSSSYPWTCSCHLLFLQLTWTALTKLIITIYFGSSPSSSTFQQASLLLKLAHSVITISEVAVGDFFFQCSENK